PIVAPAHKSEQFLVGAITSVSEIKNFVPRKPISQLIDEHLVELNFITPCEGVPEKDDRWLFVPRVFVVDISVPVPIVREPYSVVLRDEFSLSPYTLPPKCLVIRGQVPVLGMISIVPAEKGKRIEDAIGHLDYEEARKERPK